MSRVDEKIERLIVRSLDGGLPAEDEHELNRELIRNPEARRLFDEYHEVDRLAGGALQGVRAGRSIDLDAVFAAPCEPSHRSRRLSWSHHRGWLMVPGAIAAALLAMVIARPGLSPSITPHIAVPGKRMAPIADSQSPWGVQGQGVIRPVSTAPRIRSDTGREIIGVVGDDGNIYWIEVERTRTIRVPASRDVGRSAADSM